MAPYRSPSLRAPQLPHLARPSSSVTQISQSRFPPPPVSRQVCLPPTVTSPWSTSFPWCWRGSAHWWASLAVPQSWPLIWWNSTSQDSRFQEDNIEIDVFCTGCSVYRNFSNLPNQSYRALLVKSNKTCIFLFTGIKWEIRENITLPSPANTHTFHSAPNER
jgi:hypothetical protein